jgi:hypothetical protein
VTLLLDAGALIAFERNSATVAAFIRNAVDAGDAVRTTTGAVAQVWREGARQARLARLLEGVHEVELDRQRARAIGRLLGEAGVSDVVDGSIIDVARTGDEILTSDPDDLVELATVAGKTLIITQVS